MGNEYQNDASSSELWGQQAAACACPQANMQPLQVNTAPLWIYEHCKYGAMQAIGYIIILAH